MAPDAIFLLDTDLCVREVNAAAALLLDELPEHLHGRNLAEFIAGDLGQLMRLAAGLEEGSRHFETSILRSNGVQIPVEIHANRPMPDEPLIQAFFRDISAIQQSRKELHHLAHHDSLTKLPNRLLFHDRLGHALELARREGLQIAVLF
ncbi:MAG: PAS domain-containing protein, partial [Gallionella sp.]|nr:PAS domain-containing protein [Gallionella sp.]